MSESTVDEQKKELLFYSVGTLALLFFVVILYFYI